jgi:menaquinone-9 beta-reductase
MTIVIEKPVEFDVAIVGASLAGSAAAITLGRAGLRVALLDKATFPRHKPCGEGLSQSAFSLLEDLGISTSTLFNHENLFFGFQFLQEDSQHSSKRSFAAYGKKPKGGGVSRTELDSVLNSKVAFYRTISSFFGEAVSEVQWSNDTWTLTTSRQTLKARFLVLAHGVRASPIVAEFMSVQSSGSERVGYSMMARVSSKKDLPVVTVIPFLEGEIYLTRLKNSFVNVSLVGSRNFVRTYRDQARLFSLISSHLGSKPEIVWRGAGATHFDVRSQSRHPALFLVGDACQSFDPACGLGMTHALLSAQLASHLIIDIKEGRCDTVRAAKTFRDIQRKIAWRISFFSVIVRKMLLLFRLFPTIFSKINRSVAACILVFIENCLNPTAALPKKFLSRL